VQLKPPMGEYANFAEHFHAAIREQHNPDQPSKELLRRRKEGRPRRAVHYFNYYDFLDCNRYK
jgi:hypothetical protein